MHKSVSVQITVATFTTSSRKKRLVRIYKRPIASLKEEEEIRVKIYVWNNTMFCSKKA